jgi:subtilisin family serine protease
MKVTITTDSLDRANELYDMLTDAASGHGCLCGSKTCINSYENLPDIMEFDLNEDEIDEIKKIKGVVNVNVDDEGVNLHYNKTNQEGRPVLSKYNSPNDSISHSLYYNQNYNLKYTHEDPTNGNSLISLSSINCENVDIVVLDSGIDPTHPEFTNDLNVQIVIPFNWTQLSDSLGSQIVAFQSPNYYKDTQGHGTACASLIAGKKCGFAKNARIYSLRSNELGGTSDGFSISQCFELMLAFQRAKKQNLYGLNSNHPTIFSNSWGYVGPYVEDYSLDTTRNNLNFSYSINNGKSVLDYNRFQGNNSSADAYFRAIINEGVHVLVSAGNNNICLENNTLSSINVHYFNNNGSDYVIVRTQENDNSYTVGQNYSGFIYGSNSGLTKGNRYMYGSPNIGIGFSKEDYPITIVGDISPIGENGSYNDLYWSGANYKTAFKVLSSISSESRIITNDDVRYNSVSGSFFIKSAYSCFGPDVDIYAPGNGTWAALSNQKTSTTTSPVITANNNNNEKYAFFNGTSASCPIVAGILATYLTEYPDSTPKQGREWLLANSVKGNIMEMEKSTSMLSVSSYDGATTKYIETAFGPNFNNLRADPLYKLQKSSSQIAAFDTANIEDVLYCNRFFKSNNLIAQAFPIRKVVLHKSTLTYDLGGTTLTRGSLTQEKITHQ